jgi:hypothetical protein
MIPLTQTRTGEPDGNCFAAALASILECPIPEFDVPGTDYWANVDEWLRSKGCSYHQEPIAAEPPRGWHTVEGISPRGGRHAVVGYNGWMVHDPHPQDGTGRGLARPERWGVLERAGKTEDIMVNPTDLIRPVKQLPPPRRRFTGSKPDDNIRPKPPAKDSRARLHRALDMVMDRVGAKDFHAAGHECDACGAHLEEKNYTERGGWSYRCPRCRFKYSHSSN